MHNKSDEQLFALVKQDNAEAFRILYQRYNRKVFAYCLRVFGQQEAAEDAFQTIIATIFEKREHFIEGNFAGWLFTITRNKCIKALKKRKISIDIDKVAHQIEDLNDRTDEDSVLRDNIRAVIGKLPEEFRQVITLRYFEDYSYEDIADKLQIGVSLAKVRVFRAKKLLQKHLSPYMQELKNEY